MYSHDKAMKSSRRRKESQGRVNPKGWRGEQNAEKAGGHKPTAKRLGNDAADDTTPGMTLTAPVSSRKDDGESAKASHTSIVPHGTEMASRQVNNEPTDTMNSHAKSAGPMRPVGTSHDPANKLFGKREGGGMANAESVSTPIEGRSGRVATDCADEAKLPGEDLSDKASGMAKVQGGGYGGGRGSGQPANESSDSPEPPKPPEDPAQRRTESSSLALEGERRAASSCDVECTRAQADASGAPGRDQDNWKRPMKLQTTSGRVSERSKTKGRKDLPGRTKVEPGNPGCKVDASSAPQSIERVLKRPKKLANASERINESLERKCREDSPGRTRVEPNDPDDNADVSTTSGSVEDVGKRLKKLPNTSERERKRSKRRSR